MHAVMRLQKRTCTFTKKKRKIFVLRIILPLTSTVQKKKSKKKKPYNKVIRSRIMQNLQHNLVNSA